MVTHIIPKIKDDIIAGEIIRHKEKLLFLITVISFFVDKLKNEYVEAIKTIEQIKLFKNSGVSKKATYSASLIDPFE